MLTMQQIRENFVDLDTGSLKVICHDVSAIHAGSFYTTSQMSALDGLDIANPLTYHVITPNQEIGIYHMKIGFNISTGAVFEIFEDNGVITDFNISGGNVAECVNRNRASDNVCALVIRSGVTVTVAALATRIDLVRCGGAFVGGDIISGDFVLAPDTEYLFRLTSDADDNEGSVTLNWQELQ